MRRILAMIFAFLVVFPLVLSAQVSASAITFALDRDFYIEALSTRQVYETIMDAGLINQLINRQLNIPLSTHTPEVEDLLRSIITQHYFREQMQALVNGFFDYLQGTTESLKVSLDITPIKASFSNDKQAELAAYLTAALPLCESGQTPGFDIKGQPPCKPAGILDDLIEQQVIVLIPEIVKIIPDEIQIMQNWEHVFNLRGWPSFLPGMALPAISIIGVIFLCSVAGLFWYICALIAEDSWRNRLQWLGWMLVIPSTLVFLIGFIFQSPLPNFWMNYGLARSNSQIFLSEFITPQLLRVLIQSALPRITTAFIMVGGLSGALGIGLIFWGLATSRERSRKPDSIV